MVARVGDLSSISGLEKTFRFLPTWFVSSDDLLLLLNFWRATGDALKRLNGFLFGLSSLSNTSSSDTLFVSIESCFFTFFRRFGGIFFIQTAQENAGTRNSELINRMILMVQSTHTKKGRQNNIENLQMPATKYERKKLHAINFIP